MILDRIDYTDWDIFIPLVTGKGIKNSFLPEGAKTRSLIGQLG